MEKEQSFRQMVLVQLDIQLDIQYLSNLNLDLNNLTKKLTQNES